jgi:hypothetical protein
MNHFVLVKSCDNRLQADLMKAYLECEGIEVIMQADDAGGTLPTLSLLNGVSLFVPENDLIRAQKIVKEILA